MIDKHKQAFQEEAREILVDLESSLLELNEKPDDGELVSRVFRSMHTIKGSGAMFGFDDLAGFTHHLETAFDLVRNGKLVVTAELVDLSLAALDQIRIMVDERGGQTPEKKRDADEILIKLRDLTGAPANAAAENQHVEPPPTPIVEKGQARTWKIHFAPGPDFMRNGADPLLLLRELKQMGSLTVTADMAGIPSLNEMDPERCYVSWEMTLATADSQEAIRDVFIFVEDCCLLSIEPMDLQFQSQPSAPTNVRAEQRTNGGRRSYDQPDNSSSLRVPAIKLDEFVNLVGELVTVQARLGEIASRRDDLEVSGVAEEIERLTSALRESSMSIRMLPIRGTFERFRRLVHDLARDLHKEVEFTIEGADTELDKTVIDQLSDPLLHLIRNSMDHGIEPAETRLAAGKCPTARLHLSARHSGANVLITVSDDGRGIDAVAVRKRAVEKGLVAADAQLSESEVFSLILMPGFSTASQITDVSGRGVGMDVVNQRMEALRGTVDISSKAGLGTSITLRLPLTLAIIDGLLVRVEDAYYVLPLANSLECIELTQQDIDNSNGRHVANVRGELIPYIRLRDFFDIQSQRPQREQIMVAETEDGHYGFVVDEVLGDHQTVIKNLGRLYRQVQFVSGATILGNGSVALILDPHRLVKEAIRESLRDSRTRPNAQPHKSGAGDGLVLNSP